MDKDFLLYSIYTAFIELRILAHEKNDEAAIRLCNLFHNVPLALIADETGQKVYEQFLEKIEGADMQAWLDLRKAEFYDRYPKYKKES